MSAFPLLPRFTKILLTGHDHGCLPYVITLVAALSTPDLFLPEESLTNLGAPQLQIADNFEAGGSTRETLGEARLKAYRRAHFRFSHLASDSDALKLLSAVMAYAESSNSSAFCSENFLRPKAMREVQMLRNQLSSLLRGDPAFKVLIPPSTGVLLPPTEKQVKYLKQITASGFIDQVAIRADLAPVPPAQPRKPKRAAAVPYLPLFPVSSQPQDEGTVCIHPSSVLARLSPNNLPPYIIYSRLQRSANTSKVRMHPLTPISTSQLALLTRDTPLQYVGKPIKEIITDSSDGLRRECWVVPTLRGSLGSQGWPLPARKVDQIKRKGIWINLS